ncbi:unnamed protein product [Thlaspi arvense]|uniref:Trehalose-phosphatase n=1 Tax=Thlaspi arvense TaxID=13288 RepID=A0AAU9SL42_THLAR|nr:unnamed protein product [Thlaspi arvense]
MTNQNVIVSDRKTILGLKTVTVSVSDSALFSSPPAYFSFPRRKFLKLLEAADNKNTLGAGKIASWVDSMRDSSPTRLRSSSHDSVSDHDDQTSWIVRFPSALNMFDEIVNAAKGKQIVMFLDYDGTLSPIVEDPDKAYITHEMREVVKDVALNFPTAIVTGRSIDKVRSFVKLNEIYYAGSHGMDIEGPTNESNCGESNQGLLFQPAREFVPMIEKRWAALAEQVKSVLIDYPELKLTHGRKVLRERGQGFGILVSKVAKETNASYSLQDPSQVNEYLKRLVEWKRKTVGKK